MTINTCSGLDFKSNHEHVLILTYMSWLLHLERRYKLHGWLLAVVRIVGPNEPKVGIH